jgi:hypothetical protein
VICKGSNNSRYTIEAESKKNVFRSASKFLNSEVGKMKVSIDLQEGFFKDEVTVFDNDKKIYQDENVKTRTQIGLAASFDAEMKGNETTLRILIPTRQIDEKKQITLIENLHIAVSVTEENKLEWKLSEAPFMYM